MVDGHRQGTDRTIRGTARSSYAEATLWVLEENPRARAFYERCGWSLDGERKSEERWGVSAAEVRYRKRLAAT